MDILLFMSDQKRRLEYPQITFDFSHFLTTVLTDLIHSLPGGLPGGSVAENLPANAADNSFSPWVRKILWRREWQPTPVFLPGKSHGQRSLVSYGPWSRKCQIGLSDYTTTNSLPTANASRQTTLFTQFCWSPGPLTHC